MNSKKKPILKIPPGRVIDLWIAGGLNALGLRKTMTVEDQCFRGPYGCLVCGAGDTQWVGCPLAEDRQCIYCEAEESKTLEIIKEHTGKSLEVIQMVTPSHTFSTAFEGEEVVRKIVLELMTTKYWFSVEKYDENEWLISVAYRDGAVLDELEGKHAP